MRIRLLVLLLVLFPAAAAGQEAGETERDRGFLTRFLEDNLSGAGREVRIDGFAGALSSRATFERLTIADEAGIWLTIRDGAISWNRSALLRGQVEVRELTAAEIDLPRAPATGEGGAPSPEASGFSLPELPVSVEIGTLRAERVTLGEALFGAAAVVSAEGGMTLSGGEGEAALAIRRIDGPEGELTLDAAYSNQSRVLTLDLRVAEAEDGIAANLIGLPGTPSIDLTAAGSGPLDDFSAEITLATDGEPRLAGTVALTAAPQPQGPPVRGFRAALGGDISPLLQPDYRAFFGDQVSLVAEGRREPSGRMELSRLEIDAQAVDLRGELVLGPDGFPLRADLAAEIGLPDGGEVLLPLAGERTYLRAGSVRLTYDAARGEGWTLDARLRRLTRPDFSALALRVEGSGRVARRGAPGLPEGLIGGTFSFTGGGLAPADPALAQALGSFATGRMTLTYEPGKPVRIPSFRITGDGFAAQGGVAIAGIETALTLTGRAEAELADLGRLSLLAGRPLGGRAALELSGSAGLLSGVFDIAGSVTGTDLRVGQAELDRLLAGDARLSFSVARDAGGTTLRALDVAAASLTATAEGVLRTGASDVTARMVFSDLSALGPRYRGRLSAEGRMTEAGELRRLTLEGTGEGLGIGQAEADRVLAGRTRLSLVAQERGGRITVEAFELENPQLGATATALVEGETRRIDLRARLADMALLAPGFPGPLTAEGRLTDTGAGYGLDLTGQGPGGTSARVTGSVAQDFGTADLAITGGAQAALLNAFIAPRSVEGPVSFDLRMNGAPGLAALSGRVQTSGARIVADPALGIVLQNVSITADLGGGRASLAASAGVDGGGRMELSGPVTLAAPFDAALSIGLRNVRLRDPDLYTTAVNGGLSIDGPLAGGARISGALTLDETEIRVPSTGLGGLGEIPEITHLREPAEVRATRARAGLLGEGGEGGATVRRPYPLDLTISAPNRIFVRGRGLDAELSGTLRLAGTTADVQPAGQFDLIRGRLDILGQRFVLDEGRLQLMGSFDPILFFSASTTTDGVTVTVEIDGPASEPTIRFLSSPQLPEEEVLARLLFGRGLTSLSPFQAAQLASAVATLAGRGGEGIVGRLRQNFGLDDLDISTDAEGNAVVRAGKYISDNAYTDIGVNAQGEAEINLNLDLTPSVTVRGTLRSDGDTGVGLFYERDY